MSSMKARIYLIVTILMVVAIAIAVVGLVAMNSIYKAMENETSIVERVSALKDVRSEMQDVLIRVREMVISTDAAEMAREKTAIDELANKQIDPVLNAIVVDPKDAANLQRLRELWTRHKEIVGRIYDNTYANTSAYATRLATGDSLKYWFYFEKPLLCMKELGQAANTPEGTELAMAALETIESMKSIQVQEKLMILEDDPAKVDAASEFGKNEVNRYAALLNKIERMLTNPKVSDAELKQYSDSVMAGIRGKFKDNGNGTATYERGVFTVPENYYNPAFPEASRLYWNEIKPEHGPGFDFYNAIYDLARRDTNAEAYRILQNECNPTRVEETQVMSNIVAGGENLLNEAITGARSDFTQARLALIIVGIVGLAVGIILSVVAVTRITRQLSYTITELTGRSHDVERIAGQLAQGSESLANGATEQASSLEETSSALEEMASMTCQNAGNADKTRETMGDTPCGWLRTARPRSGR